MPDPAGDDLVGEQMIELKFRYLPGEYLTAVRAHQRSESLMRADIVISLLASAAGIATLVSGSPQYFWLGITFIGLSLLLPLLYGAAYLWARSALAGHARLKDELWLQFSDAGIHFRTDNIDSRLNWKLYRRALRTRGFYLLYYARAQFTVIPSRVFVDPAETLKFEDLLRRHIPKVELR